MILICTNKGEIVKEEKSLAQIAYEADENGGQQNWGPWDKANPLVREVHRNMVSAVVIEMLVRTVKVHEHLLDPDKRLEFWKRIQGGYCASCGENNSCFRCKCDRGAHGEQ